jgi:hypothetical protein
MQYSKGLEKIYDGIVFDGNCGEDDLFTKNNRLTLVMAYGNCNSF